MNADLGNGPGIASSPLREPQEIAISVALGVGFFRLGEGVEHHWEKVFF